MQTTLVKVSRMLTKADIALITKAAALIKSGELVAFPTETVYGLGANAFDEVAVKKIYLAKGRPSDNPMIVHVSSQAMLKKVVDDIPTNAKKLMDSFWPGPLTIVLQKSENIPFIVTGGLDTVAVRMPSNKIALALINASKVPIAAPSANLSGKPSPTDALHVLDDLEGKIGMILDGGESHFGLESTVISLAGVGGAKPKLLRPGAISRKQIEKIIGEIDDSFVVGNCEDSAKVENPASPGMKYKHYSPEAKVVILSKISPDGASSLANSYAKQGKKVALMLLSGKYSGNESLFKGFCEIHSFSSPKASAKALFRSFRELDKLGAGVVFVESVSEEGIGLALMNRLRKAASETI
ncbi:MAG: L-threonylcarbamoyladenylate synthase [archaeon]